MMDKELLRKIRRIEITTSRLVTDVFAGQYHSVFKGRGMEFDEVREYHVGDDIRSIDWNVTARTGKAHIKKYVEERELTVMFLVDVSMSCRFASVNQLKSKLAAEVAAVLAFSAIRNNDKVGLIIYTDKIEKFIPPRKGTSHVLRVIREVLHFEPEGKGTDLSLALEYLNRVTTRKTVSFVISDFFDSKNNESPGSYQEPFYKKAMSIANRRHDLIAVTLNDPRENVLDDCGLVCLEDAETRVMRVVDASSKKVRDAYEKNADRRRLQRSRLFHSVGMDHIEISTDGSYAGELVKFFRKRRKKLRLG